MNAEVTSRGVAKCNDLAALDGIHSGSSMLPIFPRLDTAASYRLVVDWPHKPANVNWGAMAGVAVDAFDNVWTFHRGEVPLQVYRSCGALLKSFGQGMFKNPHAVRIDRQGFAWVVDNEDHTVRKLTSDGTLLVTLGTPGEPGQDATHLHQPTDVAFSATGDIFVSDGYVNQRVVHFNASGRFVRTWGKLGAGPGEFSIAHSIGIDSKGRIYVADRNNARIQVFDQRGNYRTEWRNLMVPWAMTITSRDEIYVVGSTPMVYSQLRSTPNGLNGIPAKDQVLMKFDINGRVKHVWAFAMGVAGQQTKPGELLYVHAVAVDSKGSLYLGDIQGRRAQKFELVPATAPCSSRRSRSASR